MRREFSYLRKGEHTFPVIDIEMDGLRGSLVVKALVDSGATFSIFRKEVADYLGIPVKNGRCLNFRGIKGEISGYLHEVPVKVYGEKFDCNIAFSSELEVSFNILGRNNFFIPFLISFNEKAQKVIIEKNATEEYR